MLSLEFLFNKVIINFHKLIFQNNNTQLVNKRKKEKNPHSVLNPGEVLKIIPNEYH